MTSQGNCIIHVPRRFVAKEWGGTETVILEISKRQKLAGWLPEIYTSLALSDSRNESIDGIPIRRFDYCYPFFGLSESERSAMDKKGGNLLSLSLFGALFGKPDVRLFHAHAIKRLGGEVMTAARLRGKPFVVTLHGGVFDVPAAERQRVQQAGEGKFEWGKPFGALFGSRRLLDNADHVICVGQGEYDEATKRLGHGRISLLPNGVDLEKFTRVPLGFRARHGIAPDAFLILCLSRIDAQKNQLTLLEAFARFRRVEPRAFLVMAGPETQPDYAQQLKDSTHDNNLDGCVRILPAFAHDDADLVGAYHACDVFVLPSVHEPFGIVVLEAWASRKPVVVSRIGGLATLVEEGKTGLFFDPNKPNAAEELASKLQTLLERPELRRDLGIGGFEEARRRYAWPVIAEQLETIYRTAEEHVLAKECAR
jgi:glycosyltransferase involved in cell wall biosynthesis